MFNPWVRKIPWIRVWPPTAVFLPGKSHGERSLGYSPWDAKSRTRLSTHTLICMTDSLCCASETHATWFVNHTPIKIKKQQTTAILPEFLWGLNEMMQIRDHHSLGTEYAFVSYSIPAILRLF